MFTAALVVYKLSLFTFKCEFRSTGFGFGATSTTGTTGSGLFGGTQTTGTGLFGQQNNTLGGGGLFANNSSKSKFILFV